jgi:hypothetical protein
MIDMGDCWFDDEMTTTIVYNDDGSIKYAFYCPYIPKFLFDGDEMVSTWQKRK